MTQKQRDFAFFSLLIFASILILIKSFLATGMVCFDEAFNIANAYRFFRGDALLVDDWSVQQLHSFTLLPLVSLYLTIYKSTEGIVLYFRLCYFFIKITVAIWAYARLRKRTNYIYVVTAIILWYCFTPYNIENITYQAMPLVYLFVITVILIEVRSDKEYIVIGILYALTVLSSPFWILDYIIILPILTYVFRKEKIKVLVRFHLGIGLVLALFLVFVLRRASILDLVLNVPNIFSNPGDHDISNWTLLNYLYTHVWRIGGNFLICNKWVTILNTVYCFLIVLSFVTKKNKDAVRGLMPVVLAMSIISMITNYNRFLVNEMWIPFIWLTAENMFFEYKNKKYVFCVLNGLMYMFVTAISTDTGIYATSAAASILGIITILNSNSTNCIIEIRRLAFASLLVICFFAGYRRIMYTFGEARLSIDYFDEHITDGPLKGMYITSKGYKEYRQFSDLIQLANVQPDDVFITGTLLPIAYLNAESRVGTMLIYSNLNYERFEEYIEIHPEKKPDCVFYLNWIEDEKSRSFINKYGFTECIRNGDSIVWKR